MSIEALPALPEKLLLLIESESLRPNEIGESNAKVYHAITRQGRSAYLKIAPRYKGELLIEPLRAENDRLDWLRGRIAVPRVLSYSTDREFEYLLCEEMPGIAANEAAAMCGSANIAELLAISMIHWHSIDIKDCPFDESRTIIQERARFNVEHGLVNPSLLSPENQGRSIEKIFQEFSRQVCPQEELVLTHGDFCLPNVILSQDLKSVNGFIDVGTAGIADRYQDIAICAGSIRRNLGKQWIEVFLKRYGIIDLDAAKFDYYTLRNEFF